MRKGLLAFTPAEVLDLRARARQPCDGGDPAFSVAAEARRFSVSPETIRRLLRGETYAAVAPPAELPPTLSSTAEALAQAASPPTEDALDRFLADTREAREGPEPLRGLTP